MRIPRKVLLTAGALLVLTLTFYVRGCVEEQVALARADAVAEVRKEAEIRTKTLERLREKAEARAERERARNDSLRRQVREDSVKLAELEAAEETETDSLEAALAGSEARSADLAGRVRLSLPVERRQQFDSLLTSHKEEVTALRGLLSSRDRLLAGTRDLLSAVREENVGLRREVEGLRDLVDRGLDVEESLREEIRLLTEENRHLRNATGTGWEHKLALVGCAGGGALLGKLTDSPDVSAVGAPAAAALCELTL